jgi:hypothetical protein
MGYVPIALVGYEITEEMLSSYNRKHRLTKLTTLRTVSRTMESELKTPVYMAHLEDGFDIRLFVCCFAAGQPNPQKRTDLTRITVPQAFLAIRELLCIPSEIERVYGRGLIFGVKEGEEPDETIYPSLEFVFFLVFFPSPFSLSPLTGAYKKYCHTHTSKSVLSS